MNKHYTLGGPLRFLLGYIPSFVSDLNWGGQWSGLSSGVSGLHTVSALLG